MSDRSTPIRHSLLRAKVDEFTVVRSGPPIDRTLLAMTPCDEVLNVDAGAGLTMPADLGSLIS